MPFVQMENIAQFLAVASSPPVSLPPHDRFLTVDLYEKKDPAQVLQCLGAFSRVVHNVNPELFPTTIGGLKEGNTLVAQPVGAKSLGTAKSPISRAFNPQDKPPKVKGKNVGVTAWTKPEQEFVTAPAWNVVQYGYMGGASQGNQGITFGARRQITNTPVDSQQSLTAVEKERRRKTETEERERLKRQDDIANEKEKEKQRAADAILKKKAAEEAFRNKEAEKASRRRKEVEEALRKKETEEALRKQETEEAVRRRKEAEEALRKKETEEALRKQEAEEAMRRKEAEEALRKKETEEALRKQEAEEAMRKKKTEEILRRRKEAEEVERRRQAEELLRRNEVEETLRRKEKEMEEALQKEEALRQTAAERRKKEAELNRLHVHEMEVKRKREKEVERAKADIFVQKRRLNEEDRRRTWQAQKDLQLEAELEKHRQKERFKAQDFELMRERERVRQLERELEKARERERLYESEKEARRREETERMRREAAAVIRHRTGDASTYLPIAGERYVASHLTGERPMTGNCLRDRAVPRQISREQEFGGGFENSESERRFLQEAWARETVTTPPLTEPADSRPSSVTKRNLSPRALPTPPRKLPPPPVHTIKRQGSWEKGDDERPLDSPSKEQQFKWSRYSIQVTISNEELMLTMQ
jgi:hypothetical protein